MSPKEISARIFSLHEGGRKMFLTSSFQTQSLPLLHIISKLSFKVPVVFIQTGFLFPETLQFKSDIETLLNLEITVLRSSVPMLQQRDHDGHFYFASDPDRCCSMNKTQPMEEMLKTHDVWINGVRADQSEQRREMRVWESAPHDCKRFHPMLGWTSKMIYQYLKEHQLPQHPLERAGYQSIGCEPCTIKHDLNRGGRWFGMNKTECGLHTELVDR